MRLLPLASLALYATAGVAFSAPLPTCNRGAAKFSPCELRFEWNEGELEGKSPYQDELLRVEFRGPDQTTFLVRAFWNGGHSLVVRFTPNQAGSWAYRITSDVKRFEVPEATFTVADNANSGFIAPANVRHWWTADRKPHLWASAQVPFLRLGDAAFKSFVDHRKQDGFTHIRGIVLDATDQGRPLDAGGNPNFSYFEKLDERLLYVNEQQLVLDLILSGKSFTSSGVFDNFKSRQALLRYVVSRYSALNLTWQGLEAFEQRAGSRELLKEIASCLDTFDSFHHPRSTDAENTSSVLLRDQWENFIIESSPNPQLGAVERQFTTVPQIHVVSGVEPRAFRRELWQSTTNGEYPCVRYEASFDQANIQAFRVWAKTMSGVRHWEFEPFFDVDGARAVGLDNVEYLLYAEQPGTVEIAFPEKHKYNPRWINPRTGEVTELKDVKQDTYSETTPAEGDWILQVPRDGRKEGLLKSYKFESAPPPVQEPELTAAKVPFEITEPSGTDLDSTKPIHYSIKIKRANRATRLMQYMWIGEVVADGEGPRVLALGDSGNFSIPALLLKKRPAILNVRVNAINANGKAYAFEKAYQIAQ